MKNILFAVASCLFLNATALFAQQSTSFEVLGNCGMCKSRIEKAAKEAGATNASWNEETKQLKVSFTSNTSVEAIQKKVAAVGHDNAGAKASDEVYNKLHGCCQYERNAKAAPAAEKESCCKEGETCKHDAVSAGTPCCDKPCCKDGKCAKCGDCCKDGKCTKGGDCCKSSVSDAKSSCCDMPCCKDGKCAKCGDCCKSDKKASCCADGKCSKPGHSGKDCCKKS